MKQDTNKPTSSEARKDLNLLRKMIFSYDANKVSQIMSPTETMVGDNYMWVGSSAIEIIMASAFASRLTEVKTILDMPCGHGRVLRHLAALFPDASIDACDLDEDGMRFCAEAFGSRSIPSQEDLTKVVFDQKYDLIWIGSLFTHTSYETTKNWLTHLAESLTPTGIIVATFHGRWATCINRIAPYIDAESWAVIMEGYKTTGYGFADYPHGRGHDFIAGSYGVSVATPSKIISIVEEIPGVRVHFYQEKGWGNNHDVLAFGRPDWDESHTWPK